MKKILCLCLLVVLTISLGCEKDEILTQEQNEINLQNNLEINYEKQNNAKQNSKSAKKPENQHSNVRRKFNVNTDDDSGTILTNNKLLIDYGPSVTEEQKEAIRAPYYSTGQLMFTEQCTNYPNKELWHTAYNFTNTEICNTLPCVFTYNSPLPVNSTGQIIPPAGEIDGLIAQLTYSQTCQ